MSPDELRSARFPWARSLLGAAILALGGSIGVYYRAVVIEGKTSEVALSYLPYAAPSFAVITLILCWFGWEYDRRRSPAKDREDKEREDRFGWRRR